MNSNSRTLYGNRVTRSFSGTVTVAQNIASIVSTFNVTGFGNGDHIKATAGSFNKSVTWKGEGYTRTVNHLNGTYQETSGTQPFSWDSGSPIWSPDYTVAELRDQAVIALYEKLQDRKFDFGVTAGESPQTKRMIDKAVKGVFGLVSTARKIRRSIKRFDTKAFANAWLEYTYGWVPICSDIYNLVNFSTTKWKEHTVVVSRKSEKPVTSTQLHNSNPEFPVSFNGFKSNRVRYSMTVRAIDQEAFDLSRLGSMDPKVIAWELLPYSFVVDWVWDIGGYLAAQETALLRGLEFVRGHYTTGTLHQYWQVLSGSETIKNGTTHQTTTKYQVGGLRSVTKSRVRLLSQPIVRIPPLKVNLGSKRIISAAALFRQVMR